MTDAPEHLVKSYDQELKRLGNLITEMGGIVESQVALAAAAIMDRDAETAMRVIEGDPQVDALEHEVEQFVIRLLALRQQRHEVRLAPGIGGASRGAALLRPPRLPGGAVRSARLWPQPPAGQ